MVDFNMRKKIMSKFTSVYYFVFLLLGCFISIAFDDFLNMGTLGRDEETPSLGIVVFLYLIATLKLIWLI